MLGMSWLDIAIIILYFIAVAVIGFIATWRIRNREDFLMGGRKFGKTLMIFFQFSSGTHADGAVAVASSCYKFGFAGIWYQWVMLFTLPIYWLLAPIFRRARVLTTADFFERRFGRGFGLLYSFSGLFIAVGYTSVMLFASAKLVESLTDGRLPCMQGVLLLGGVSFVYGIAGGLVAAAWNDALQGVLTIVMSVLIIPFFWAKIGGLPGFQQHLANPHQTFQMVLDKNMTLYWIIMMAINTVFTAVSQPHLMSALGASRTEMDSRVGYVGGMLLKRIMTVPWALTGVMAIALFGAGKLSSSDHAFGDMAKALLPMGFRGLMLACVMAAIMDQLAVSMLSFAAIYTNSIHKRFFNPELKEKRFVLYSRLSSTVFAVAAILLCLVFASRNLDVPAALRFMWVIAPLMGIPFFLALLWRRANRWGAFASYIMAFAAMLAAVYLFKWKGDAGLPKTLSLFMGVALPSGILVSLLTQAESKRMLDRFYLLLKIPVGREDVLRKAGLVEIPGTGTFDITAGETSGRNSENFARLLTFLLIAIGVAAIGFGVYSAFAYTAATAGMEWSSRFVISVSLTGGFVWGGLILIAVGWIIAYLNRREKTLAAQAVLPARGALGVLGEGSEVELPVGAGDWDDASGSLSSAADRLAVVEEGAQATAIAKQTAPSGLAHATQEAKSEISLSRRQAFWGVVVSTIILLSLLGVTKLMAMWMAGDL